MGVGAPTIMALAELCGRAIVNDAPPAEGLSLEARTILYAARQRGILEIKATNTAFESPERFLTVYVELDTHRQMRFRKADDPRFTIRFLEGFRQLCRHGAVMHHLFHEFSLTTRGFDLAAAIEKAEIATLLAEGQIEGWQD